MMESATFMRPANHDSVHNSSDLSRVPSIPEVQHMVGFAKENLPGSIRQLKTIGLPLTICSQESNSFDEKRKNTSASRYALGEQQCHASP